MHAAILPLIVPAFTFQSSKILLNSHSKQPGCQAGCMWVGKKGWRWESLEGKDRANSSYHDFSSPHLRDGIFLKALDLWTRGVGELRQLIIAYLSVPLSPRLSLPLHTSFQPLVGSASPACYIWEEARKPETNQFFPAFQHNSTGGGNECQPDHFIDEKKLMVDFFLLRLSDEQNQFWDFAFLTT